MRGTISHARPAKRAAHRQKNGYGNHQKGRTAPPKGLSLSDYYPKNTVYFYSFPAGRSSNFYNQVPTYDEELVSGRALVCAGDDVRIVTFAATADDYVLRTLSRSLPMADPDHIITLPADISASVTGDRRDRLVKRALSDRLGDGELVMAQPFMDAKLAKKFKISPKISVALSDKNNMHLFIPKRHLPRTYAVFADGQAFHDDDGPYPMPCVVKVASSSSGDGVVICRDRAGMVSARRKFRNVKGSIQVGEHIEAVHNLCVQFGIPYDGSEEPTVIGFNEQITSDQGDFLGGIVNLRKSIPALEQVNDVLLRQILPAIRDFGWYGVGGIDVMITEDGDFYFIDPNLRLTATYAYVYLARMNDMDRPLLSFTGSVHGTVAGFERRVMPFAEGPDAALKIVALTRHGDTFRFNAAITFDSMEDLKSKAAELLDSGIESSVLSDIIAKRFDYSLT